MPITELIFKKNRWLLAVCFVLILGLSSLVINSIAFAVPADDKKANVEEINGCISDGPLGLPQCGKKFSCKGLSAADCQGQNPIIVWINFFINVFAAVVGVGAVAMLIFAGVQYTAAADKPDQVEAAKKKIGAVVLGLVAFIFLYAFLNWLIPGGVIG